MMDEIAGHVGFYDPLFRLFISKPLKACLI